MLVTTRSNQWCATGGRTWLIVCLLAIARLFIVWQRTGRSLQSLVDFVSNLFIRRVFIWRLTAYLFYHKSNPCESMDNMCWRRRLRTSNDEYREGFCAWRRGLELNQRGVKRSDALTLLTVFRPRWPLQPSKIKLHAAYSRRKQRLHKWFASDDLHAAEGLTKNTCTFCSRPSALMFPGRHPDLT